MTWRALSISLSEQVKLPVQNGLGDDFINFDEDPQLPPGSFMKAPLVGRCRLTPG
jgi:hypothetical protein